MNHYAVFIKLMEKKLPNEILYILEQWFDRLLAWSGMAMFLTFQAIGTRQGGVLSSFLFAIFIDSVVDKVRATNAGTIVC